MINIYNAKRIVYGTKENTYFDTDTINFIDAAGLNSDANLNVGGLYTAEQARMAVHVLISGLKSIKDSTQLLDVWERNKSNGIFLPYVGGNPSQHALNLFNPSTLVSSYIGSGLIHDGTGVRNNGVGINYIDTGFNPTTQTVDLNNQAIGFYASGAATVGTINGEVGNILNSPDIALNIRNIGVQINLHTSNFNFQGINSESGLFGATTLNSTQMTTYKNSNFVTASKTNTSIINSNVILLSQRTNDAVYRSFKTVQGFFYLKGLTIYEFNKIDYLMNIYQANLNRKV